MLAWLFTALMLVLVVVCIAAGRGAIPVNHLIGVRIPALKRSPGAWRAGHAAGVFPAGVAFIVGLVFSLFGFVTPMAYWGSIVAFLGGVVWVFIRASRAAKAS
ncbi:MAG: hypothetical protein WBX27_04795 [Specibacter sp.]